MPLLELNGIGKRFGGLPAVADVSFSVDAGEIVALVGPNGAGKSTLLKTIGGLHAATTGTITVNQRRIGGDRAHRSRWSGVAMVMQTPRPFGSMTVIDNCMIGALFGGGTTGDRIRESAAHNQSREMLEFVGLADRADEPVSNLNLHEQRFLEIARQLASKPDLILLDEVMAGLNDTELDSSIEMVRRARDELGVTVVWVEHVMKAVMSLAERILVLNFGSLIADGEPQQVMSDPNVIAAYLGTRRQPVSSDGEVAQ